MGRILSKQDLSVLPLRWSATAGLADLDLFGFLDNSFNSDFIHAALRKLADPKLSRPLAAYVHLPFCASRCHACTRQSQVSGFGRDIDHYLDHLEIEAKLIRNQTARPLAVRKIQVGGGTPNLMREDQLARLCDVLSNLFVTDDNTEQTIEIHPAKTSESQLQLLAGLGFNSIIFQLRDTNTSVQNEMSRRVSLSVVADAFRAARHAGFQEIASDFVFGLPGQTVQSVRESATDIATVLNPDRIYGYSFSKLKRYSAHQRALVSDRIPSVADRLVLFHALSSTLKKLGYQELGIDSFARPGDRFLDAQAQSTLSRDWTGFSIGSSANVLGIGSHSVSEIDTICYQNEPNIGQWQTRLANGDFPVRGGRVLDHATKRDRDTLTLLTCSADPTEYAKRQNMLSSLNVMKSFFPTSDSNTEDCNALSTAHFNFDRSELNLLLETITHSELAE